MIRCGVYNRVSTSAQNADGPLDDLVTAAERRGYVVTLRIAETGSGARNDRPGLQRILEEARKGQLDAVLVTRLDRFGRSSLDLLANVRALVSAGVRFTCTEQAIDISPGGDPMGQLVLTVLAGVAEFERAIIRDRVVEGQRRAVARGVRVGRPRRTFDQEQARALIRSGIGVKETARRLRVSPRTLRRNLMGQKSPELVQPDPPEITAPGSGSDGGGKT